MYIKKFLLKTSVGDALIPLEFKNMKFKICLNQAKNLSCLLAL